MRCLQVLYGIRDQEKMRSSVQEIVAGIENLKIIAAKYGEACSQGRGGGTLSANLHKRTAGWVISKMRVLKQEDALRVWSTCIQACLTFPTCPGGVLLNVRFPQLEAQGLVGSSAGHV